MPAINPSKLGAVLRARFSSPSDVLKRLGIAADIDLADAGSKPAPGGQGDGDALRALRGDIERLISESKHQLPDGMIEKFLALLDAHVDLGALPDNDSDATKAIALGMGGNPDGMPLPATRVGPGGKLAGDRLAMDANARFHRMFPELQRITAEPSLAADARPRARPTRGAVCFEEMFPDAGKIGVGAA